MTQYLFDLTFVSVVPFWALMILAPGWHRTRAVVASHLVCVPPLVVYAVLVLPEIGTFAATLAAPDLAALQQLLGSSAGAAAAWAHFIAFDLFLGRWIYFDSRQYGIHPAIISVLLVFTIVFAPLGVLIYLLVRSIRVRQNTSDRSPFA